VQRRAALGGNVAVVTHGLVLRALLDSRVHVPAALGLPAPFGNTGLSIVSSRPPHGVSLLNCTAHLDGRIRDDARALSGG
jgi:probable phosphoglycerate mutase